MACAVKNVASKLTVTRLIFSSTPQGRFGSYDSKSHLKPIGRLTEIKKDGIYPAGQMFMHKIFAYRGIIMCSFNCPVHVISPNKSDKISETYCMNFYQALIHRGDWKHMNFPSDLTCYLGESGGHAERPLTIISGMDCIAHDEVLPYRACDSEPIDHDLFDRIFEAVPEKSDEDDMEFGIRKELKPTYFNNKRSWLAPREVYKETTNEIQVTVVTFYLGINFTGGQQKHCWRYTMRLENLEKTTVFLRERSLKVFSLNNMQQLTTFDTLGPDNRLTVLRPAYQYSNTIDLPQRKGAHMWGKFKMEREDGSVFDVIVPTIVLESDKEPSTEQSETQQPR